MAMAAAEMNLDSFGLETAENEHLTFMVGDEKYGMEIGHVREIIGMTHITRVPHLPAYMAGVMNLRGKVIPVMDLRIKFNRSVLSITEETCIIVVDAENEMVGLIADSVSDVVNVPEGAIEDTPHFGSNVNTDFISGTTRMDDGVVLFLDLEKTLGVSENHNL